jgi:RNA ligase (TIGR02306 family)
MVFFYDSVGCFMQAQVSYFDSALYNARMRKIAYVSTVAEIVPIPNADAIESVRVGGWLVAVKKSQGFQPGEKIVYIELDAFLPDGYAPWQFLVDRSPVEYQGRQGYVLKTAKLKGRYSQGFVCRLSDVHLSDLPVGEDVASMLGILKYDPPLSQELMGVARGYYPSWIPKTDQERIQNLEINFEAWKSEESEWELSEKLEGQSSTFAWIDQELHVCSRTVDFLDHPDNALWNLARRYRLADIFAEQFGQRSVAIQGEMVGPGIEGNIYGFKEHDFFAYAAYDLQNGSYLLPTSRRELVAALELRHVPVLDASWKIPREYSMPDTIKMADGYSQLSSKQRREGVVAKRVNDSTSFKVISNLYLS